MGMGGLGCGGFNHPILMLKYGLVNCVQWVPYG